MKNVFLCSLLVAAVFLTISFAKADVGMPKTFDLLISLPGPMVSGQLSEIKLSQFKLSKDQVCGQLASFDYSGAPLHLTIGGEDYVTEANTSVAFGFGSSSCDLSLANVQEVLMIFKHPTLNVRVGIDIDFARQSIEISSHDIGSAVGTITSKY